MVRQEQAGRGRWHLPACVLPHSAILHLSVCVCVRQCVTQAELRPLHFTSAISSFINCFNYRHKCARRSSVITADSNYFHSLDGT